MENDFSDFTRRTIQKQEERVLNEVLTELLGHPPTIEDYKKCTIVTHEDDWLKYGLSYDHRPLGTITKDFGDGFSMDFKCNIFFTPFETKDNA